MARTWSGTATPAFSGAADAGTASGAPDASTTAAPFLIRGAISARLTTVSPQAGQDTRPRSACASNAALSRNQPSKWCSALQRNW